MKPSTPGGAPPISPLLVSMFGRYAERSVARSFHAVRLARAPRPDLAASQGRPLVLYLNHPSWWDPLIGLLLAQRLFPERRHYGPVAAAALRQYRFFEKLGFFAIEPGTPRGARRFLEVASAVLQQPDAALWITASGHFTDPRERPVRLQSGLGHLASRVRQAVLVPLALEYPFWTEKLPEALARFGEQVLAADAGMSPADWTVLLEERLEAAQDGLAADALARDPARFEVLLSGGDGTGGVYGAWRRLRSRFQGERPPKPGRPGHLPGVSMWGKARKAAMGLRAGALSSGPERQAPK